MSERQIDRSAWILPYVAGVVDSDGCITIKRSAPDKYGKRYYGLRIIVAQCSDDDGIAPVIEVLQHAFGGAVSKRLGKNGRRTMWHWCIASKMADTLLRKIQPYLIGKQKQAIVALEYREHAVGKKKKIFADSYYRQLRALKNYKQVARLAVECPEVFR